MGIQLKRNAIFELSIVKNPLMPAVTLFACIFLFGSFGVWAWYRIGVWMFIGKSKILYFFVCFCGTKFSFLFHLKNNPPKKIRSKGILSYLTLKRFGNSKHRMESQSGISNNGFVSEDEPSQRTSSKATLKLEDDSSPAVQHSSQITTDHSIQVNDGKASIEMHAIESVEFMVDDCKCKANVEDIVDPPTAYETITESRNVQQHGRTNVNKYDEISSADDIREICIEKREPNGKTYFIEIKPPMNFSNHETASLNSSSSSTNDECQKSIMENVLKPMDAEYQRESEPHSRSHDAYSFDESDPADERKVKAVVHVSDETIKQNEIDSNDVKTITIQPQMNEIPLEKTKPGAIKAIETRRKLNFRIGAYEAIPKQKLLFENDDKRMAFKMRLENLFGQSECRTLSRHNSPPMAHALRVTNSAPESLILLHSKDDSMTATKQQCQSKLPLNNNNYDANGPSKIPIPPIFNQQLYDTVGRRNKNIEYQTAQSTPAAHEIDIEVSPMPMPVPMPMRKSNISRSHAHENLTIIGQNDNNVDAIVNDPASETIKQKLEEIFSRGRTQCINGADTFDQNDGIVLRKIEPIEPFDTVKRQKLIFSNVLKSIRPDSSTNLRRTSSSTSTDIKNIQPNESVA